MSNPPQDPYSQEPAAQPQPQPQPADAPPPPGWGQQPGYAAPPGSPHAQPQPHGQQPQQPYGGYGPGTPQTPPPAYGPAPGTEKNWMGTTALVLSLVGFFTGITAIGGIVFGHLSLSAVKRGEADNRGMGLAGLIIGYVIVALGIIALVAFVALAGWVVTECGGDNPADWCNDINVETTTGALAF